MSPSLQVTIDPVAQHGGRLKRDDPPYLGHSPTEAVRPAPTLLRRLGVVERRAITIQLPRLRAPFFLELCKTDIVFHNLTEIEVAEAFFARIVYRLPLDGI